MWTNSDSILEILRSFAADSVFEIFRLSLILSDKDYVTIDIVWINCVYRRLGELPNRQKLYYFSKKVGN